MHIIAQKWMNCFPEILILDTRPYLFDASANLSSVRGYLSDTPTHLKSCANSIKCIIKELRFYRNGYLSPSLYVIPLWQLSFSATGYFYCTFLSGAFTFHSICMLLVPDPVGTLIYSAC